MNKVFLIALAFMSFLSGCGTLDKKTILINSGDSKEQVLEIMGVPYDRQFKQSEEAWQYCVSGAGIGYNDHKIIWFENKKVTGITTYRTQRTGCTGAVKTINWEEAPDLIIENRQR